MASCLSPLLVGECLHENDPEERIDEFIVSCQEFTVHYEKYPGAGRKAEEVPQEIR